MRNLVLSVLGAAALSLAALSLTGCADAARQHSDQEHATMAECCEHAHAKGMQCSEACCKQAMEENHACKMCMDAKCGTADCASMAHCEGMSAEDCAAGGSCCAAGTVEGKESCPAGATAAKECGGCPGKVQG
ncbi:MAG: hypothetical protein EYC70_08225 [Planctomycetota bacterium]|nr:MAG: hypothetical protein EYC70_08225 [Planctomycetota bacterium]